MTNTGASITIDGRKWPINTPTDGQLLGMSMLSSGKLTAERSGALLLKMIEELIPDEAYGDFVEEYISGNYGSAHLTAVIKEIIAVTRGQRDNADKPAPAKKTARKAPARKRG